jgi:hypothetical protein
MKESRPKNSAIKEQRRKHRPFLISDEDRFRLLHDPYEPPLVKKGTWPSRNRSATAQADVGLLILRPICILP